MLSQIACEQNTCSFIRTTLMSLSDVKYDADSDTSQWTNSKLTRNLAKYVEKMTQLHKSIQCMHDAPC